MTDVLGVQQRWQQAVVLDRRLFHFSKQAALPHRVSQGRLGVII